MTAPKALIIRSPGTNCDEETAYAFHLAGVEPDRVHINRVIENPDQLHNYQILCLAGGFSFGDDISAGRIVASLFRNHLLDDVRKFRDDGKLILGICNGLQVLIKSGLLLEDGPGGLPQTTLAWNDCQLFQDRWVTLHKASDRCVFLQGVRKLYLPVAHAEGRFVAKDKTTLENLAANGNLCLTYGSDHQGETEISFPDNPNGSALNVAGICDNSGRVFGLMPHPERYVTLTQHPRWTRGDGAEVGDGLQIFKNAAQFFA